MNRRIIKRLLLACLLFAGLQAHAQESRMTLDEAVTIARARSVPALEARSAFISSYWAYRSYRASMLPSLSIYGDLGQFNRNLTRLQNYNTGEYVYTRTNNMTNSMGLAISQNIALTGGTVRLFSDLSRIDQFGDNPYSMWYSQPLTLYYSQPIFSYNQFKWNRLIEPKQYEKAKRIYLEAMEDVTVNTVKYYFALMMARKNYDIARSNYENTSRMHEIAEQRLATGSVTRDECLQLELRMLSDSIAINENETAVREAMMALSSQLGLDGPETLEPASSADLPDITMDYDMVMDKAWNNSSFSLDNDIKLLDAKSAIAKAKANRGITMALNATFGLSQTGTGFRDAFSSPLDQEVVGLSFTIPIFDWGMGKGRVKEAEAQEEAVKAQITQAENDYRRSVFSAVGQFNKQRGQCIVSERAARIAQERYSLTMDKFRAGSASVTDLNTAQSENDAAAVKYITDLSNFWNYYYALRKLTLYDFLEGHDIDVDFENMTE